MGCSRDGCGSCCCCLIVTCIFLFFALFFSLFLYSTGISHPVRPTISIEEFYIPSLDKTSNETNKTTIFFELKLNNSQGAHAIRYETIKLFLFYSHNVSVPIANMSIPGFHQNSGMFNQLKEIVQAVGMPWETARMEVSQGNTTFRVNVNTKVKYGSFLWKSKTKAINVSNNLPVNDRGSLMKKHRKGVKLKSSAVKVGHCAFLGILSGVVFLLVWS